MCVRAYVITVQMTVALCVGRLVVNVTYALKLYFMYVSVILARFNTAWKTYAAGKEVRVA